MTDREFFVEKAGEETEIFERLIKALPADKLGHTHHPKSKTAGELAKQMADEALSFKDFLATGVVDWSVHAHIDADVEKIAAAFVKGMTEGKDEASKMSDEEWDSECKAIMNGAEVMKTTRGKMAWLLMFDLIHHRGQLSTYIRPMGGKVPSIYGPTADTMGV